MVTTIIESSTNKPFISMDKNIAAVINSLKEFLFEKVYLPVAVSADQVRKVAAVMRGLFQRYMEEWDSGEDNAGVARRVCDHIAGMTDRYAMAAFVELFVPSEWGRVEAEPHLGTPPQLGVES